MDDFNWAQRQIDAVTGTEQQERHETQRTFSDGWSSESRAQRRDRDRKEKKAAKKAKA